MRAGLGWVSSPFHRRDVRICCNELRQHLCVPFLASKVGASDIICSTRTNICSSFHKTPVSRKSVVNWAARKQGNSLEWNTDGQTSSDTSLYNAGVTCPGCKMHSSSAKLVFLIRIRSFAIRNRQNPINLGKIAVSSSCKQVFRRHTCRDISKNGSLAQAGGTEIVCCVNCLNCPNQSLRGFLTFSSLFSVSLARASIRSVAVRHRAFCALWQAVSFEFARSSIILSQFSSLFLISALPEIRSTWQV